MSIGKAPVALSLDELHRQDGSGIAHGVEGVFAALGRLAFDVAVVGADGEDRLAFLSAAAGPGDAEAGNDQGIEERSTHR